MFNFEVVLWDHYGPIGVNFGGSVGVDLAESEALVFLH